MSRGSVLPVYVLADESGSMKESMDDLNEGMDSLHEALLAEPMAAAKVRFSVLGFSNDVQVRMHLADLRRASELPKLVNTGGVTNYGVVFGDLLQRIPADVRDLKAEGYQVHRPAVFLLSDGQPTDEDDWRAVHRELTDRSRLPVAPNIIACGVRDADAATMVAVATQERFAFVAIDSTDVGPSIAKFCAALTQSLVQSGRAIATGQPELVVAKPEGFRLAIDVV